MDKEKHLPHKSMIACLPCLKQVPAGRLKRVHCRRSKKGLCQGILDLIQNDFALVDAAAACKKELTWMQRWQGPSNGREQQDSWLRNLKFGKSLAGIVHLQYIYGTLFHKCTIVRLSTEDRGFQAGLLGTAFSNILCNMASWALSLQANLHVEPLMGLLMSAWTLVSTKDRDIWRTALFPWSELDQEITDFGR